MFILQYFVKSWHTIMEFCWTFFNFDFYYLLQLLHDRQLHDRQLHDRQLEKTKLSLDVYFKGVNTEHVLFMLQSKN